ncbi:MAG: branched-chain amino acid transport system permease protein, partial [Frankiaceae bacterium]|nr:branched-chain amino acid transport system permease protein [Frankiaceae bacterium]
MTALAPAEQAAALARRQRRGTLGILVRVVVAVLLAYFVGWAAAHSREWTPLAIVAAVFAMVGLSLNILIGYTGQLSLGHQGFLGAGACAAAFVQTKMHAPFAVAVLSAVAVGALFALVLGFVALRIRGLYLALITLVFGLTLSSSLFLVPALTGGGAGQKADRPAFLQENTNFYWFCLALVLVVLYLDSRLLASKAGRALLAIKENERVAEAFGIGVTAYKLLAFGLSGAIAGLAGGLFAFRSQTYAAQDFTETGLSLALLFVVMVVVGGLGNRVGVVIAGSFFALLNY